jgi:hypothetical protein
MAIEAREAKPREKKQARVDREAAASATSAAEGGKRKGYLKPRAAEHAVFLVPGLLGFENFDTFNYFADRVTAALRAGLEQTFLGPVPVIAVPIPPTASLRDRQRMLVKTLADRLHAYEHGGRPLSVHLVGHSTGGVDANLLTNEYPLAAPSWEDLDPRAPELRKRIRSRRRIKARVSLQIHSRACSPSAIRAVRSRSRASSVSSSRPSCPTSKRGPS